MRDTGTDSLLLQEVDINQDKSSQPEKVPKLHYPTLFVSQALSCCNYLNFQCEHMGGESDG